MKRYLIRLFIGLIAALLVIAGLAPTAQASDTVYSTAESKASAKVKLRFNHVGEYVLIAKSKVKLRKCFWASGTWTNTADMDGSGDIDRFQETSRAKFCPLKKPVVIDGVKFHHVKADGGRSGSECFNPAIPPGHPQPPPQLRGFVWDVRDLSRFFLKFRWSANAYAIVNGTRTCPDGSVLTASARGVAKSAGRARLKLSTLIGAHGKGTNIRVKVRRHMKLLFKGKAFANATAQISLTCGETPPTFEAPTVDVTPVACVEPGQSRDVTVTVFNPNSNTTDEIAKVFFRSQSPEKPVASPGQVTFTFPNVGAGTYTGSALLVKANKSKSFTVNVEECDVPTDECPNIPGDQPPGYDCTGPQGRIVGPLHMYEHGTATYRVRGWDNTDGANVDIDVWFTGNITGSFVREYIENGQKVVEFILVAGPNSGTDDHGFIHARITDQDGLVKLLEPHKIFVEEDDRG